MQLQPIFDNLCRCFGHPLPSASGTSRSAHHSQSELPRTVSTSNSRSSGSRRRTNRLELNAKEYDALFEEGKRLDNSNSNSREQPDDYVFDEQDGFGREQQRQGSQQSEIDHAHALAKAKLAANPSRYRSKRKRSGKAKEDIFRSKDAPIRASLGSATCTATEQQGTFSRLLNPSVALCFATPVRGSDEPEEMELRSQDASEAGTLNTCEDTITSTLYLEAKYKDVEELQPPMPLFNQFKIGHQKDEIKTIIEQDSHSSAKMIRLLNEIHGENTTAVRTTNQSAKNCSPHRTQLETIAGFNQPIDANMEDVPDVKACSTDSSRRTDSSNHSTGNPRS